MKPALIGPLTIELDSGIESRPAEAVWANYEPPLGILTVGSILRRAGMHPITFDLDGFVREFLSAEWRPTQALPTAAEAIGSLDTDLFGFGTMCGSFPFTLRLAEAVKRKRPDARILLGGPQASSTDVPTLEAFDCVDAVVRGEIDQVIVPALDQIARGGRVDVPGVTYRQKGRIWRNPDAQVVLDLDAVPPPAFELCEYVGRCSRLPVEIGRGCPFACTFCSTNDFFRRRFRLRSPECVIAEMRRLESMFGVTDFDLVHDMFTVDRKRVIAFCQAMQESGCDYTWHCSARTDFVDLKLIETMRRAGCAGLFFGVETGSPRLQKVIEKDLSIPEAIAAIEMAEAAGLRTTVSLIVGFPEETRADLDATSLFALQAARCPSSEIQVGLLSALAGTPLYRKWREHLTFDGIIPELNTRGFDQDEADRLLIQQHPDLFSSFYAVPAGAGREYTAQLHWFLKYALSKCRWLAVAMGIEERSITAMFDDWLTADTKGHRNPRYYTTFEFAQDLCRFAKARSAGRDARGLLACYYESLHSVFGASPPEKQQSAPEWPIVASDVTLLSFPFCPSAVISALCRNEAISDPCFETTTVAVQRDGDRITDARELPHLASAVLRLCDGRTSPRVIQEKLHTQIPSIPGFSAEHTLQAGLQALMKEGLLHAPDSVIFREPVSTS